MVDEAIERVRHGTRHLRRSTGAGTLRKALDPRVGKTMDPLAPRGRGKVPRVCDGVEAVACDDVAYGVGTPEHAGLLGLVQASLSRRQGIIGTVACEGPHDGGLQEKRRQKFIRHMAPLIGTQPFRLKFPWSCLRRSGEDGILSPSIWLRIDLYVDPLQRHSASLIACSSP